MAVRTASIVWDGPARDILAVFVEPTPRPYGATVAETEERVLLYRRLDEQEEPTGEIVGVEIEDFLDFDQWGALPTLDRRWQLPGEKPLPLDELLRRQQRILRAQAAGARTS